MSRKRPPEGIEAGTTNGGATSDDYMHGRDKQGRARVWGSEEEGASQRVPRGEGAILTDLPDACVCMIVSYLSPKDVARGACVCQGFRNTLDSDNVWDLFVPKPAVKVVALNDELKAATKKKMFTFLCKPFLLTDTLAYWLDQGTGGVCYSVGAKGLRVVWGDDNRYWEWSSRPGARWPEVAGLREVCWFHTSGTLKCELPPGAYTLSWRLQYEMGSSVRGWDRVPTEFSVSTTDGSQRAISHRYMTNWPDNARQQSELGDLTPVRLVEPDNWFEFDAGEITVAADEAAEKSFPVTSLEFSMVETESGHWKSGIILDGVVLRPSAVTRTTGRYLSVEEMGHSSLQNHEPGPPVEGHPVGLLDPRGRLGGRGPIRGLLPRRRGGVRLVQPNGPPPHFDAGEN